MASRHHVGFCFLVVLAGAFINGCGLPIALDDNTSEEDACLDLWSIVHFASGYYLGNTLGDDSFEPTLGILTGWEVLEPRFWPGFNESQLNQQCDLLVGTLGWLVEARE